MKTIIKSAFAACLALFISGAFASPVLWTLSEVQLLTGSKITGSFVFDADTRKYSKVQIHLDKGLGYHAEDFTVAPDAEDPYNPVIFASTPLFFDSSPALHCNDYNPACGSYMLAFWLQSEMTNQGGTMMAATLFGHCGAKACNDNPANWPSLFTPDYFGYDGFIIGTPVPEPATNALIFAGIMTLCLSAWRSRRSPMPRKP
ncbi:MAG: hypothetical protein EOP36_08595 [Rubrivivax sp.]|nr:MAG: hypothetical protein EOP36_08595 [Rubrivivax sp.]